MESSRPSRESSPTACAGWGRAATRSIAGRARTGSSAAFTPSPATPTPAPSGAAAIRAAAAPLRSPDVRFGAWRENDSMAIDFESEGLLEGTEGKDREARLRLLEELAGDGVPLEDLRRAVDEDRLALLPVERFLEGGGQRYTLAEVADEAGVDADLVLRLRQAVGMPRPDPDKPASTEEDLEAARRLRTLLDAGLPEEGLVENSRVIGLAAS